MPRTTSARLAAAAVLPSVLLAGVLLAGVLLAAVLLAGCRIVDQRTFERAGLYPSRAQLASTDFASRAAAPMPLAIVRFGTNDDSWRGPLLAAARAAQARKADVQFDLVAPIPLAASPEAQERDAQQGAEDAAQVAGVLQADGVAAEAIHLGQRGDRGNPPRQVELYVR